MDRRIWLCAAVLLVAFVLLTGCAPLPAETTFRLDADSAGVVARVRHIENLTVVSNDPNVYKAEYEAGFIQGRLQKDSIIAARDNTWDVAYLTNPAHSYPKQIPPSQDELSLAQRTLKFNWDYTLGYIRKQGGSEVGLKLRRLMYRLVGIYHGTVKDKPQALAFDDTWFPAFSDEEMTAGYETPSLTFVDVYFVNAFGDLFDVLPDNTPPVVASASHPFRSASVNRLGKCSAFVKRTADDIFLTHNSWYGFLDQSQVLTLWINGDFMTVNILAPGFLGSGTDFGYTNKGLIFNETTHRAMYSEPKANALWMFWRATLAEQFATSLDEFFRYVSLEPSGTYMNGYMVVDAKAISVSMIQDAFHLKGVLDTSSPVKAFWMKFGTPYVNGKPFIWSESQWKGQKLRDVPDVVDGSWTLLNAYIR